MFWFFGQLVDRQFSPEDRLPYIEAPRGEQAIELMMEHMAAPLATIEAEVDRFIGWPGQALAYQIGNRKFCDLRARAEARLGGRFNRRAFHDALMAAGPVTLDVLDEHIEAWIAEGVRCTPVQTV